jgi:hypothetical protein
MTLGKSLCCLAMSMVAFGYMAASGATIDARAIEPLNVEYVIVAIEVEP